jgi:hypothetical protein
MSAGQIIDMLDKVCTLITRQHNAGQREIARMRTQLDQIERVIHRVSPARIREVSDHIDDLLDEDEPDLTPDEWNGRLQQMALPDFGSWVMSIPNRVLKRIPPEGWDNLLEKVGLPAFRALMDQKGLRVSGAPVYDDEDAAQIREADPATLDENIQHIPHFFCYWMPERFVHLLDEKGLGEALRNHFAHVGVEKTHEEEEHERWERPPPVRIAPIRGPPAAKKGFHWTPSRVRKANAQVAGIPETSSDPIIHLEGPNLRMLTFRASPDELHQFEHQELEYKQPEEREAYLAAPQEKKNEILWELWNQKGLPVN